MIAPVPPVVNASLGLKGFLFRVRKDDGTAVLVHACNNRDAAEAVGQRMLDAELGLTFDDLPGEA